MILSIETPVIKGGWLIPCIESVLAQTSTNWEFSLVWDGGDALSKTILEKVQKLNHPKIKVYFQSRQGIAPARRFLTEHSSSDYILTLDDDDLLAPNAVEQFLKHAASTPWSGIIRARRGFVDEQGHPSDMEDWFPFTPRHYTKGMTQDLYNQAQPYLIKRQAYEKTSGWEGFEDYCFAGEDCDIFTKVEEVAEIELLDECLYYYRVHPSRTSDRLGTKAAEDMWRRLADKTIQRRQLPLQRTSDVQPFEYAFISTPRPTLDQVDFVIPFWESHDKRIDYPFHPTAPLAHPVAFELSGPSFESSDSSFESSGSSFGLSSYEFELSGSRYSETFSPPLSDFDRFELFLSSHGPVTGHLHVSFYDDSARLCAEADHLLEGTRLSFSALRMELVKKHQAPNGYRRMEVSFFPQTISPTSANERPQLFVFLLHCETRKTSHVMLRLFQNVPNYSRHCLETCLQSLQNSGIRQDAIHVIEKQQSAAANRNEGMALCSKPTICFLDDDVEILAPHTLIHLLEKQQALQADIVGPKLVDPHGKIYCADPYFDRHGHPKPRGLGEPDTGQYAYDQPVPWLPSTLLIVNQAVCASVGGFDEHYVGSQMEDVDFCLRARSRGFRCYYVGGVAVRHYNCERNNQFSKNFAYFQTRWKSRTDLFEVPSWKENHRG